MTEFCCGETAWQTRGRENWSEHDNGSNPSRGVKTEDSLPPTNTTAPATGRRIYIHEGSLARLARQNRESARLIYETLARVSVLKILHHRVLQDGVQFRRISSEGAQRLADALEPKGSSPATSCLHSIGYRTEPKREPQPLLGSGEEIVASCYFDQYYTFATDEVMAIQMYRDLKPMVEVRKQRESGEGYQDLLLINGWRSTPLEFLGRKKKNKTVLSEPEAARIRAEILQALRLELTRTIEFVPLTGKERIFALDCLHAALGEVFSHGVLKTL